MYETATKSKESATPSAIAVSAHPSSATAGFEIPDNRSLARTQKRMQKVMAGDHGVRLSTPKKQRPELPALPNYQKNMVYWTMENIDPGLDTKQAGLYVKVRQGLWYSHPNQVLAYMGQGAGISSTQVGRVRERIDNLSRDRSLRFTVWLLGPHDEGDKLNVLKAVGQGKPIFGWAKSLSQALDESSVLPHNYEVAFSNSSPPAVSDPKTLPEVTAILDYWEVAARAYVGIRIRRLKTYISYEKEREKKNPGGLFSKGYKSSGLAGARREKAALERGSYPDFVTRLLADLNASRNHFEAGRTTLAGLQAKDPEGRAQDPAAKALVSQGTQSLNQGFKRFNPLQPNARRVINLYNAEQSRIRRLLRKSIQESLNAGKHNWLTKRLAAVGQAVGGFITVLTSPKNWPKAIRAGLRIAGKTMATLAIKGFKALCKMAGIDLERLMKVFKKGSGAFQRLRENPRLVLKFLVGAVKGAFELFKTNLGQLLLKGLIGFLVGCMAKGKIIIPATWNLKSVAGFLLQVANITMERLKKLVIKLLGGGETGKARLERLEKIYDTIAKLFSGGASKILDNAKDMLTQIKEKIFDQIKAWLMKTVIGRFIVKLVAMFAPIGALITIITTVWNLVSVLRQWASRIAAVIEMVFNSLDMIAKGEMGPAAKAIYDVLANILPIGIGFMAGFLGLGNIARAIGNFLKKAGNWLWEKITMLVKKIINYYKRLFSKDEGGKGKKSTSRGKAISFPRYTFSARGKQSYVTAAKLKGQPRLVIVSSPGIDIHDYLWKVIGISKKVDKMSGLLLHIEEGQKRDKAKKLAKEVEILAGTAKVSLEKVYRSKGRKKPAEKKKAELKAWKIHNHLKEIWALAKVKTDSREGEFEVNTYSELTKKSYPGMNAHHVPQNGLMGRLGTWVKAFLRYEESQNRKQAAKKYFKHIGLNDSLSDYKKDQGIAIVIDAKRHKETKTYLDLPQDLGLPHSKNIEHPAEIEEERGGLPKVEKITIKYVRKEVRKQLFLDIKDLRNIYEGKKFSPSHPSKKKLRKGLKGLKTLNKRTWGI